MRAVASFRTLGPMPYLGSDTMRLHNSTSAAQLDLSLTARVVRGILLAAAKSTRLIHRSKSRTVRNARIPR